MEGTLTNDGLWYHVVTVVSLILFKLAVLVVGYLIAKLGRDLLFRGITGEFKFQAEFHGSKADLVSASPGLFFILMAATLIAVGVVKDKPFATRVTERIIECVGEHESVGAGPGQNVKPELPVDPN